MCSVPSGNLYKWAHNCFIAIERKSSAGDGVDIRKKAQKWFISGQLETAEDAFYQYWN